MQTEISGKYVLLCLISFLPQSLPLVVKISFPFISCYPQQLIVNTFAYDLSAFLVNILSPKRATRISR